MRNTCPNCNHALTIREAIQSSCATCVSVERRRHTLEAGSSSSIKANFDALVSEELKKRSLKCAA
jgi:hypothetical protein